MRWSPIQRLLPSQSRVNVSPSLGPFARRDARSCKVKPARFAFRCAYGNAPRQQPSIRTKSRSLIFAITWIPSSLVGRPCLGYSESMRVCVRHIVRDCSGLLLYVCRLHHHKNSREGVIHTGCLAS